jgi:hypothetical protein
LKLINDNLNYANVAMSIAAIEVAAALGVDPRTAATVIAISSGASHGLNLIMDRSSMEKMTGATSNFRKGVAHLIEVLETRGKRLTVLTDISQTTADRVSAYATSGIQGGRLPQERRDKRNRCNGSAETGIGGGFGTGNNLSSRRGLADRASRAFLTAGLA